MFFQNLVYAKSLGWREDVEGRRNMLLGWALAGKKFFRVQELCPGTSKKNQPVPPKKWVSSLFLLSSDWGGHSTLLTFKLLFPVVFWGLFPSITAKKIINMFFKHSENLDWLWHRLQGKLIVKITTNTGVGREKGIFAHQWAWVYYHTLKNVSAGDVSVFFHSSTLCYHISWSFKICAKATGLVRLGQIVLGVSFFSRYFYSSLNFDVCLNCKTVDFV